MVGVGRPDSASGDRAISNLIGVILLMAITVTLAGAFTAFFFGFGDEIESVSPTFATDTDFDDTYTGDGQTFVIEHLSGESVDADTLTIVVRDAAWEDTSAGSTGEAVYTESAFDDQVSGTFAATNTIELNRTHFEKDSGGDLTGDTYLDLTDATVYIRWEDPDPDEDRADLIYECEVEFPDCARS